MDLNTFGPSPPESLPLPKVSPHNFPWPADVKDLYKPHTLFPTVIIIAISLKSFLIVIPLTIQPSLTIINAYCQMYSLSKYLL